MNIETWLEFLDVLIYTLEQGKEIKRHTYWKQSNEIIFRSMVVSVEKSQGIYF